MVDPLSLKELNILIKTALDSSLEPSYWVVAEIGELRMNPRGHCYMELVEKEENRVIAKIRANIWANTYRNISTWFQSITGESIKKDLKVMLNVTVQYHELYGMSLVVKDIEPSFTLGERARQKQEIIRKLEEDGVIEMNQQLILPLVPQKIAIISSATAAGYGDFINHLEENVGGYFFDCTLYQSLMQGNEAEDTIISSLHQIFEKIDNFDLVVLIRGGGSQVDLDCFDSYELASHIAQFPIPIIAGIGHERDQSIVDMVAHRSMKTPTAVAEFLIGNLAHFENQIDANFNEIKNNVESKFSEKRHLIDKVEKRIQYGTLNVIASALNANENYKNRIHLLVPRIIKEKRKGLLNIGHTIEILDPKAVLKRGYSITRINGIPISKLKKEVKNGDKIETVSEKIIIHSSVEKAVKNGK